MKRYEVEMSVTVTLEIDETASSEYYPGETVLNRHANAEWQRNYYGDIGFDRSLMDLAVQVGIDRRPVSSIDGWADFPDEAVKALGFPDWHVHDLAVTEVPVVRPT